MTIIDELWFAQRIRTVKGANRVTGAILGYGCMVYQLRWQVKHGAIWGCTLYRRADLGVLVCILL